jgi:hypothetical protein
MKRSGAGIFCIHFSNAYEAKTAPSQRPLWANFWTNFFKPSQRGGAISYLKEGMNGYGNKDEIAHKYTRTHRT